MSDAKDENKSSDEIKRFNEICLKFNSGIFPTQDEWAFYQEFLGEELEASPELTAKIVEFWEKYPKYAGGDRGVA
jgi:hypothetical protein